MKKYFKFMSAAWLLCMAISFSACSEDTIVEFPPSLADINIEKIKSFNAPKIDVNSEQWGT